MPVDVDIRSGVLERLTGRAGRSLLLRRAERTAARARVLGSAHGSLGRHIDVSLRGAGTSLTAVISCNHPAAAYVVFGTRPHVILPRRARALKFDFQGRTTYAKRVNHPGYRGDNFLARALRETS